MQKKVKNILLIIIIWTITGLLYSAQSYYYRLQIGQQVEWLSIMLVDTPYFLLWAFFTPVAIFAYRRFPFSKNNWLRFIAIHIFLAAFISFTHSFIYNTFRLFVTASENNGFEFERVYLNAVANFDYGLLVYFVTLLVINIFDYYRRLQLERTENAELQTALIQSHLSALKMKLQPHFLFNTLNSISVLIKDNPQKAGETINLLSDLLRQVLKNSDEQFNELEKEIEFLNHYLAIEQVRFGERLKIKLAIDPLLKKTLVPSLILQPLVENAVRHGIAQKRGLGIIEIKAYKNNQRLHLEVIDNGKGFDSQKPKEEWGLGLKITRERLNSLYKNNFKMNIQPAENGGTLATLQIPIPLETEK